MSVRRSQARTLVVRRPAQARSSRWASWSKTRPITRGPPPEEARSSPRPTRAATELGSAPGAVGQVRECAARLVAEARARGVAVVLVGHDTKDGGLAGPRVLEHLVDTVLSFEGDRHHALRLLRAVKHRFGGTAELGVF